MGLLELRPEHVYFHKERKAWEVYPGTTEILKALGFANYDAPWFNEWNRDLGSALHACNHLLIKGTLDWDSVDEDILPEARCFERFWLEGQFKAILSEALLHSHIHRYAGTLDLFAWNKKLGYCLIDYKRTVAPAATALQLAAYAQLIAEYLKAKNSRTQVNPLVIKRFGLVNFKGERPKIIPFPDVYADRIFLSLVSAYHWGLERGIFKPKKEGE